jgi:uncharacterized OB-fold protein
MANVGKMIELIGHYPKDFEVVNEQNEPFIHLVNIDEKRVILSTKQPIGECKKCGQYVYPEEVLDYPAVCPGCDENKYSFEFVKLNKKKKVKSS